MAESLKFYCDENVAKAIAEQLASKGVDIVRCQEVDMMGVADEEHFAYAIQNGRIVITEDNDFLRLNKAYLEEGLQHPGIFFVHREIRSKKGIGAVVRAVLEHHSQVETSEKTAEDFHNQVIYVK